MHLYMTFYAIVVVLATYYHLPCTQHNLHILYILQHHTYDKSLNMVFQPL